jgi:hypothetical protein
MIPLSRVGAEGRNHAWGRAGVNSYGLTPTPDSRLTHFFVRAAWRVFCVDDRRCPRWLGGSRSRTNCCSSRALPIEGGDAAGVIRTLLAERMIPPQLCRSPPRPRPLTQVVCAETKGRRGVSARAGKPEVRERKLPVCLTQTSCTHASIRKEARLWRVARPSRGKKIWSRALGCATRQRPESPPVSSIPTSARAGHGRVVDTSGVACYPAAATAGSTAGSVA